MMGFGIKLPRVKIGGYVVSTQNVSKAVQNPVLSKAFDKAAQATVTGLFGIPADVQKKAVSEAKNNGFLSSVLGRISSNGSGGSGPVTTAPAAAASTAGAEIGAGLFVALAVVAGVVFVVMRKGKK